MNNNDKFMPHNLYQANVWTFLFQTLEDAKKASTIGRTDMPFGSFVRVGAYSESEMLKRNLISVSVIEPNSPIFLLEKIKSNTIRIGSYISNEYWKVIIENKVGWICLPEWLISPLKAPRKE